MTTWRLSGTPGVVHDSEGKMVAAGVPMAYRSTIVAAPLMIEACRAIVAMDNLWKNRTSGFHERVRLRDEAVAAAREALSWIGP